MISLYLGKEIVKMIEAEILEQVKILKSEALKGEHLNSPFYLFIFHYSIY